MRIAVVGFCFNHPTGLRNLQALKELANRYATYVHIFTVNHWGDFDDKNLGKLQTKYLRINKLPAVFFSKEPSQYKYWMRGLFLSLLRLRPDIVYAQNEPIAIDTFVALLAAKCCKARFGFFSWENICNDWFFPLNAVEKLVLRVSDFVIAGTLDVKDMFLKKGANSQKIVVCAQTGIDTSLFRKSAATLCARYGIKKSRTVLFVGRLLKMKGIDIILKAKEILDRKGRVYHYLFVGSGEMSEPLRSGISNVVVVDWMPTEELPKVYNSGGVLVYPSIPTDYWIEQFGYSMVEALSCEIPVIASDVSGPRAIVEHGKSGLLIPVGNAKKLARAIELLLEDRVMQQKFGATGRKRVLKEFGREVVASKLFKLFASLL
jgi:glycosyltransferase involved in cell wall biosynthesis